MEYEPARVFEFKDYFIAKRRDTWKSLVFDPKSDVSKIKRFTLKFCEAEFNDGVHKIFRPIGFAILNGSLRIAKALVERGVSLEKLCAKFFHNSQWTKYTPIAFAVVQSQKSLDLLRFLHQSGGDLHQPIMYEGRQTTPLTVAMTRKDTGEFGQIFFFSLNSILPKPF